MPKSLWGRMALLTRAHLREIVAAQIGAALSGR
jgi:hypothetical protein